MSAPHSTVRRLVGIWATFAGLALSTRAAEAPPAFADEFTTAALGPAWRPRQGIWKVADGAVSGRKDPSSKHPAKLDLLLPQRDGVLEFSFKTDLPGGFDLFFNRGDIRVAVVELRGGAMAFATFPKTRAGPSEPTYMARSERSLTPKTWHAVRIERRAGVMRIKCDDGAVLEVIGSGLEEEATTWMFNLRGPPEMTFWLDHVRVSAAP
jgi:hypothetical protein